MTSFARQMLAVALVLSGGATLAEPARFDTPEAGFAAVMAGLEALDRNEILRIFGPEYEDILSTGNPEDDREIWRGFYDAARVFHEIVEGPPGEASLYFGRQRLTFPFPLVQRDGAWIFDGEVAREEILMRRIGRNELAVIDILGRAPEIQAEYRRTDHDGDGVMEFAAAILSSPGNRDGLYWPEKPGTEPSPYGEAIARASLTGFTLDGTDLPPEPLSGYLFVILQAQGPLAPGGAYSYLAGENMVAGHAVAAFPAIYGETGVMSFMVGENGVVHEADLGQDTLVRAAEITVFDPGAEWTPIDAGG